jgi:hypothetical protein
MKVSSIKMKNDTNDIIKNLTNKVLELVIVELNKNEMKQNIATKIIHPLLYMIYSQLYPYIYTIIIIILLMFLILVVLLVFFIIYLRKN